MACSSKMAGRRAKGSEIWDLEVLVTCIWATFDLLVLNVIRGSSGGHSVHVVSQWPVTQKWLALARNWVKFGSQG